MGNRITQFSFFNRNKIMEISCFVFYIFLLIHFSACGEPDYSHNASSDTGSITFSVMWQEAPTVNSNTHIRAVDCVGSGISTVEARVYDANTSYIASGGPWNCSAHSGHISYIPSGTGRRLLILGKDSSDNVIYWGQKDGITITKGQTTDAGVVTAVQATSEPLDFSFASCSAASGDEITVSEVNGTVPIIVPGAEYAISGTYSLNSRSSASIIAANYAPEGTTGSIYNEAAISSGSGNYTTTFKVLSILAGWDTLIGIGFYPSQGGDQFFGTDYGCDFIELDTNAPTNTPPTATITNPADGSVFASGENISFAGEGNDDEDGSLTGSSLVWTSNLDGQIGTGLLQMTTSLSVGTHTITLTVTDSNNDTGTDMISISVFQNVLKVPSSYSTIQDAIDTASNGDIVLVADGTYSGTGNKDLDFGGKAITVQSENGPSNCTIDSGGSGRGFYFHSGESSNSVVSGFTITNGNITYETGGGGILCDNFSSPTIKNCIIKNNTVSSIAWGGGGISCVNSSPTITNCLITGNNSNDADSGGGIYINNASPTITNCTIVGNSVIGSTSGGGIYFFGPSSSKITNCIFWNNTPDEINTDYGTPSVTYSDIQGGFAGNGNINSDPLFIGAGDYQLGTGSPCIDSGSASEAPSTDIEDNARPQGSGYDMGAYEATP